MSSPFRPTGGRYRSSQVLAELDQVGPYTVVWLNETQDYLGAGGASAAGDVGDDGERVAAKLRRLLGDLARAPVLVLGTLWPEHHAALTRRPGLQVAQVLDGTVIEVPAAFTGADLVAFGQAAGGDARLATALHRAEAGQLTQYLAGGAGAAGPLPRRSASGQGGDLGGDGRPPDGAPQRSSTRPAGAGRAGLCERRRLGPAGGGTKAREMYDERGPDGKRAYTVAQIAETFGVGRATIYRHLQRDLGTDLGHRGR